MDKSLLLKLNKKRNELNLSFDKLSILTHIPATTLRRYFNGVNDIPTENCITIAKALQLDDVINNVEELTNYYERLNDVGKQKVLEYIALLMNDPKYIQ